MSGAVLSGSMRNDFRLRSRLPAIHGAAASLACAVLGQPCKFVPCATRAERTVFRLDENVHALASVDSRMARTRRVWIVEDNRADTLLIEMALQKTGVSFEKTLMRDGETAILNIRACQAG